MNTARIYRMSSWTRNAA